MCLSSVKETDKKELEEYITDAEVKLAIKDYMQMRNYRPLSLLNNDCKLFAKILAICLERVVHSLVHFD